MFMNSKDFRLKVQYLWKDCIAHGPRPWENKQNIIGEALMVDYPFDKDKLILHIREIYELISMVHKATTYEDMKSESIYPLHPSHLRPSGSSVHVQ